MIRPSQADTMNNYDDLDSAPSAKWLVAFKAALRGRLLPASLLGCVLGASAAAGVFFSVKPEYQGSALIRVKSTTPTILRDTGDTVGRYDQYLGAQVQLIKSGRVTDMAMRSPVWTAIGRGLTPAEQHKFRSSLSASSDTRSEVIRIRFNDEEKDAAEAGADAIVKAYLNAVSYTHLTLPTTSRV